ncbi:DUF7079 family protein [Commensalibacter nepenthis]|uniref:DUF7079 domain-containing protein n=1 Tax=Commensalibacter nepenthis TaxID=3043872 RepID=A0ABT6Q939_9PROT|nr:hypothetical protein [Commensalibacter sp. TBRC 10068]MDI2113425.1 hypothetical protein [Commensalibacter sp. TBRC 10068]
MNEQYSDIDLCEALSEIFVDNEVEYYGIAYVAKNFPIEHVEMVYFEWVAPICYSNLQTPVPPIWTGFDREWLWKSIQEYRAKNSQLGRFRLFFHKIFLKNLRNEYITRSGWNELKQHLELVKKESDNSI